MRDELNRTFDQGRRRREFGWHPRVIGSSLARVRSFILHPAALMVVARELFEAAQCNASNERNGQSVTQANS